MSNILPGCPRTETPLIISPRHSWDHRHVPPCLFIKMGILPTFSRAGLKLQPSHLCLPSSWEGDIFIKDMAKG
jgi:hypothetical protein